MASVSHYLRAADIAGVVGCHVVTVYRWLKSGVRLSDGTVLKLACRATPHEWLVTREDLDAFLLRIAQDRQADTAPVTPRRKKTDAELDAELARAGLL